MLRRAYRLGVLIAVDEVGFSKEAASWPAVRRILFSPAALGGMAGAGGEALAGGDASRMARAGLLGAGIGAGVRYLPSALRKVKPLTASSGTLSPGVTDLSWIAPSFLLAPALTGGVDVQNRRMKG